MANNLFGERLEPCSMQPITGYFRDGCCNTDQQDTGIHTVCAIMSAGFLEYSRKMGNDLSTPRPEFQFPGLKPGDRWCLCAARWKEAWIAGKAPMVVLEATHEKTLEIVDMEVLLPFAYKSGKTPR